MRIDIISHGIRAVFSWFKRLHCSKGMQFSYFNFLILQLLFASICLLILTTLRMTVYQKYLACKYTSCHPYNTITILTSKYWVKDFIIFKFVHIEQETVKLQLPKKVIPADSTILKVPAEIVHWNTNIVATFCFRLWMKAWNMSISLHWKTITSWIFTNLLLPLSIFLVDVFFWHSGNLFIRFSPADGNGPDSHLILFFYFCSNFLCLCKIRMTAGWKHSYKRDGSSQH